VAERIPPERLQPSLLDRLRDDQRGTTKEPLEARVLSKRQLRDDVKDNLHWLMNATRLSVSTDLSGWPEVETSILNFGLPAFSGETASSLNVQDLESAIRDAIICFEPRILPTSLEVTADENENMLDCHNVVGVRISAQVWAQPVPFELLLRAEVDLETGLVTPLELPH